MTFFKSSTSVEEANPEENYEQMDYENGYDYSTEYDGNMDEGDMYYPVPMPSEDINYEDDIETTCNVST